ncbi:MAG: thioredoxin [Solirubrobacterales bacterium]
MTEIEHLTEATLDAALAETPGPVVVDFWAEWCGPCQVMAPMLERIAREHPEIRIAKVDVDDEPALGVHYGISAIPTLIRFDGGNETLRVPGALPYDQLLDALGIGSRTGPVAASSRGRSWRRGSGSRRGTRR